MTKKKNKPSRPVLRAPQPPEAALLERARLAHAAGALGEATTLAEQAYLAAPARLDVLYLLSACWVSRGDQDRALEYARQATEVAPADPKVWNHLGWCHLRLRQFREAKEAYLRAISADPNLAEAYFSLARAEAGQGEATAAADHLVQALTLDRTLAERARRELSGLASQPALAEWMAPPKEKRPAKRKPARKTPPAKKRRR